MAIVDYISALTTAVHEVEKFQFVAGTGDVRDVVLKEGGTIDDHEIAHWSITEDAGRAVFIMRLMGADRVPIVILTIQKDGVWKGRDRKTRSTIMLRPYPLDGHKQWEEMADPSAYFRSIRSKSAPADFRYLDPLPRQKDWSKEERWSLAQEIQLSDLPKQEVGKSEAGVILGWNRTDYFTEVVQSIAQNPESQTLPWFLFLDKYEDQRVTDAQINVAQKLFPKLYVIQRDRNLGCGRNIIDARRQIFDELGFDYGWFFEDDLVVAPNYMQYCRNLMTWGEANYDNCGAVQGWIKCKEPTEWKTKNRHKVRTTYDNWWAYMMSKKSWNSMNKFMFSFQDLFLGGDYNKRPHRSIVDWFRRSMKDPPKVLGHRLLPEGAPTTRARLKYFGQPPTGQDAATMVGFYQAGWGRLTPIVNRSRYIGMHGIHMNTGYWERMKFGEVNMDIFPGDHDIESFVFER